MDNLTPHLWIGFIGGLLGFAHCLGMCGGFVVQLSLDKDRTRMITAQLLWQAGKICSYACLGAAAGYAGGYVETVLFEHTYFQDLLGYAAGAMIVLSGASLLGLLPIRGPGNQPGEGIFSAICQKLFSAPAPGAALLLGMAAGLLPCPIVLAFLAYALQSGSVSIGMAVMGAMGIGTMLPLLMLGTISRLSGLHLRRWGTRTGGAALVVIGMITMLRGTEIHHRLLGCPAKPEFRQAKTHQQIPCCRETNR